MAGPLQTVLPLSSRFRGFILLITFLVYVCYHMSRKPISIVKVRLAGKGEHSAGHVGPGRHVGRNRMFQTSGCHLPSSLSLVAGTVPSTCQIPTVGGSFLQSSCNVFLHIPLFTFQTAALFGVCVGGWGQRAEKAEVLGSAGGGAGGREHGLWWEKQCRLGQNSTLLASFWAEWAPGNNMILDQCVPLPSRAACTRTAQRW